MRPLVLVESRGETPTARLLRALGVVFTPLSFQEALAPPKQPSTPAYSLIISEEELAEAVTAWAPTALRELTLRYRSVLLYPFSGTSPALRALRECVGGNVDVIRLPASEHSAYSVGGNAAMTGPFARLTVSRLDTEPDYGLVVRDAPHPIDQVVSVDDCGVLTRITLQANELFVASSSTVFDVEAEMVRNLDARRCFPELVPLLFFLRHSEAAQWHTPYQAANVIIDDLNLRPNYGFVNVKKLAEHIDELRYAVSVAFIPWNYSRTSPTVVELFRRRWPRLSVCVHGCDHVGAEFATASLSTSIPMISLSLDRMRRLKAQTGLTFDRVMVFPQGKFSEHSMHAFRQSEFLATVNTELLDDRNRRGVSAGELLAPAITSHGGFPLFLRRKAIEPIANFALDLLLGKPCLVVTHHDDFQRGMQPLGALVESLNGLSPALHWTNLEEIVSRTYSSRRLCMTSSDTEIRLYASTTTLEPQTDIGEMICSKAEPLEDKGFEVFIDGQTVRSHRERGDLKFRLIGDAGERKVAEIRMSPVASPTLPTRRLSYRTRVTARRYLSEIRDNYVSRSPLATAVVRSTRQLLKRSARVRVP